MLKSLSGWFSKALTGAVLVLGGLVLFLRKRNAALKQDVKRKDATIKTRKRIDEAPIVNDASDARKLLAKRNRKRGL